MRVALGFFFLSIFVTIGAVSFETEIRNFFRGTSNEVLLIEEFSPIQLTLEEVEGIVEWKELADTTNTLADFQKSDMVLFYSVYEYLNLGQSDIENASIVFDEVYSPTGNISIRIRHPLPTFGVGQIEPRRFAWNKPLGEPHSKRTFKIPLLKKGEAVKVFVLSDEFGSSEPSFRAENVQVVDQLSSTLDYFVEKTKTSFFDWFRRFSIAILVISSVYLGMMLSKFQSIWSNND